MKYEINVTANVTVSLDETKFTAEFLAQYREYFYPFQTINDHVNHLAWLAATGAMGSLPVTDLLPKFIEGYGMSNEFGIEIEIGGYSEYGQ